MATAEEKRQNRVIPFVSDGLAGRYSQELLTLICRQPIPEAHSETFRSFDAANACS